MRRSVREPWQEISWWGKLPGAIASGDGYKLPCIGHEDHNPSLSVSPHWKMGVLLKDHSGRCTGEEIRDAARDLVDGTRPIDLEERRPRTSQKATRTTQVASDAVQPLRWLSQKTGASLRLLKALGVTEDEDRVRYSVPGFPSVKTRVAGGDSGTSRWDPPKGKKPPLWPAVPDELEPIIALTEGETDCIALRARGWAAFSLPNGVDSAPSVKVLEALKARGARTIAIATDADESGDEGGDELIGLALEAGLDAFRLRPPDYDPLLNLRKDWCEHLAAGGRIPTPDMAEHERKRLHVSMAQVLDHREPEWVVEDLIAVDAITLVAGSPKSGKSTMIAALLEASQRARPFMGRRTFSDRAMYMTEEAKVTLSRKFSDDYHGLFVLRSDAAGMTFAEALAMSAQAARKNRCRVLVIDTVSAWHDIEDENDAAQVTKLVQMIRQSCQGLAVVLVHHLAKAGGEHGRGVRGSGAWTATVDVIVEWGWPEEKNAEPTTRVMKVMSRFGQEGTPELFDDRYQALQGTVIERNKLKDGSGKDFTWVMNMPDDPTQAMSINEMIKAGVVEWTSYDTVKAKLTEAAREGHVMFREGPNNKRMYWREVH